MRRSARMRATGWTVVACGLMGAAARYWIVRRGADVTLDDTVALGYSKSMQHGVGVMMGRSGELLTDVSTMLATPIGQALLVLAAAALIAAYFFRVAWVIEDQHTDRPST
ncbi:MAG TPA: hypothetical protein VKH42_07285 [Vicinamibacterales bacterium]|nr:hypothetical protein [Vicinamibacterales bacterium]